MDAADFAMNHTQNGARIAQVLEAWTSRRPTKSFAGMSLAQFKTQVEDSIELRDEIAAARINLAALLARRAAADAASLRVIDRVVNGVIADADEGYDGDLFEAMGYVRKSKRASGLQRKPGQTARKQAHAK